MSTEFINVDGRQIEVVDLLKEAVPLSSLLGEAFRSYYFYAGRVYSTRRGRTAKSIGYKTPNGTDVVRFALQYRDPNHPRRRLSERIQLKLSVIQQICE